jgi:nitrite reductase/ring-hydroxylating ferredoxin subunit
VPVPSPSRRSLLWGGAGCLALAACGTRAGRSDGASLPVSSLPSAASPTGSRSAATPAAAVAASAEVRAGVPLAVSLPDGRPAFLVRAAGGVQMLDGTCTHAACAVTWQADRKVFLCPCHLSQFDATGRVITPPATDALHRIGVQERDGHVYLA